MKKLIKLGFTLLFVVPLGAQAETLKRDEALKLFFSDYQNAAYAQGLETLQRVSEQDRQSAVILYWSGVSESKLQRFAEATKHLSQAVKKDGHGQIQFEDAPYILGQAAYAIQDFKHAKEAFQISVDRSYKVGASLYYIGYVENLMNADAQALKTFDRVMALPASDSEMKQPAAFQMGEVYFEQGQKMAAKTDEEKLRQKVLLTTKAVAAYQRAIGIDESGPLAVQANGRIIEINLRYGTAPVQASSIPRTLNGTPLPASSWVIRLNQDAKYDTNIVNQADGKLTKVSYTGAALSKTAFFGKYEYVLKNRLAITPELSADYTVHNQRNIASVFTNDATTVAPALRGRLDETWFGNPSAFLPEYEFNYSLRDYHSLHLQDYYSKSHNFVLGERFKYLKVGETTIKPSIKFSYNNLALKNFIAPKVSLSQNIAISRYIYTTGLAYEAQSAKDPVNDQRTTTWSNSFGLPNLFWTTNVDFSFSLTWTDTLNQYVTRGLEKTISPGITLTKNIDRAGKFNVNLNETYTRNISLDLANYDYTKHVFGIGGAYTF